MSKHRVTQTEWEAAHTLNKKMTVRCHLCGEWETENTLYLASRDYAAHRETAHPEIRPKRRTRHRSNILTISPKTVEENIAGVRVQGGATWERVA